MSADVRLSIKPENQRMLSHIADRGTALTPLAALGGEDPTAGGIVELTNGGFTVKLCSCREICCKMATGSGVAGWSNGYDWTLNAVRIAENKPAYTMLKCQIFTTILRNVTYKNEVGVDDPVPSLDHLVTVSFYHIGRVGPGFLLLLFGTDGLALLEKVLHEEAFTLVGHLNLYFSDYERLVRFGWIVLPVEPDLSALQSTYVYRVLKESTHLHVMFSAA